MRMVGLVAVVVVAACSSQKPSECATAGSRLHPTYRTTKDGLHEFLTWHDTLRDEDCYWQTYLDNTPRCLPHVDMSIGGLYSDAACSQPAGLLPSSDTTTKYMGFVPAN